MDALNLQMTNSNLLANLFDNNILSNSSTTAPSRPASAPPLVTTGLNPSLASLHKHPSLTVRIEDALRPASPLSPALMPYEMFPTPTSTTLPSTTSTLSYLQNGYTSNDGFGLGTAAVSQHGGPGGDLSAACNISAAGGCLVPSSLLYWDAVSSAPSPVDSSATSQILGGLPVSAGLSTAGTIHDYPFTTSGSDLCANMGSVTTVGTYIPASPPPSPATRDVIQPSSISDAAAGNQNGTTTHNFSTVEMNSVLLPDQSDARFSSGVNACANTHADEEILAMLNGFFSGDETLSRPYISSFTTSPQIPSPPMNSINPASASSTSQEPEKQEPQRSPQPWLHELLHGRKKEQQRMKAKRLLQQAAKSKTKLTGEGAYSGKPRNLQCEDCGRKFIRTQDLRRHVSVIHRLPDEKLAEKPFACEHCCSRFTRRDALRRHIKSQRCNVSPADLC
ncbi:hypothetical protein HK102_003149 [Quaeritorhiza haematococci]|nr:hypothetical protein HK102_003149 [Quaeritorhiza haematococci]